MYSICCRRTVKRNRSARKPMYAVAGQRRRTPFHRRLCASGLFTSRFLPTFAYSGRSSEDKNKKVLLFGVGWGTLQNYSYSTRTHLVTSKAKIIRWNARRTSWQCQEAALSPLFPPSFHLFRTQTEVVTSPVAIRCLSFTVHDQRGPSSPRKACRLPT